MSDFRPPNVGNAVSHFLDRHLEAGRGERAALHYGDLTITYAELLASVSKAGNLFAESNVDYENRVVLVLPDCPLLVACLFGLMRIGAVPVPLSPRLSADDYLRVFADCRPKAAVIGKEHTQVLEKIRTQVPFPQAIWVMDGDELPPGQMRLQDGLDRAAGHCPVRPTSNDDMALIQYTSGSTGMAKGVVHLHRGLREVSEGFGQRLRIDEGDVCFSAAKLSFGYGLGNSVLFPFGVGASSILLPGVADPYVVYETIQRYRPTLFFGVPSLYSAMLKVPGGETEFDLSSIRLCVSAGEHLSAGLFDRWKETFGHEIMDGIGATECLHIFISGEEGRIKPGSTGTVVPGYEVKLLDDEGEPVRVGEIGQLYVKGKGNGARYWNKHDETLRTMIGPWTRTGDLFYQDEEGHYFFVGRSDDVIKVGSLKVSPVEVEECLLKHQSVRECAVVGVKTEDGLSTISAYVCLTPGWEPVKRLERELKKFVRNSISPHKCPNVIEFVPELPRTTTGKIARHKLRAGAHLPDQPAR